jgi:hypothetical protein
VKYVSDKYAGVPFAPITIPEGASFADMVALKGKSDIGDQINKKIIAPLANANKLSDMPDFNEATKLGSGKEMVDRLSSRNSAMTRFWITKLELGGITVDVVQKDIKHVHLSVYPPNGRVKISAPLRTSAETIRVFALSKIGWIRQQQANLRGQERESPREYLDRESH